MRDNYLNPPVDCVDSPLIKGAENTPLNKGGNRQRRWGGFTATTFKKSPSQLTLTAPLLRGLITALILCLSLPAFAADRYQVELIIFTHITPESLASEKWLPNKGLDIAPVASIKNLSPTGDGDFTVLPSDKQSLNTIAAQIAKKYPILLHMAWTQPINAKLTQNPWIVVSGGDATSQISGRIRLGHPYLYEIQTHLHLSLLSTENKVESKGNQTIFPLDTLYRTKLGKLFYIDHPLMGVIVTIKKVATS